MTPAVTAPPLSLARPPATRTDGRALLALPVWLLATAGGFALVKAVDPDPFVVRGAVFPLAVLGLLALVMIPLCLRFRNLSAVACGLFAGWVALALRAALNGTPYGFAGLYGDMGRIAAAAMRYSVTPWSSDAFVEDEPAEYPMLYPWLIGRAAALVGIPAWRLVGEAEILTTSGAVVVAFLLWSRLVRQPLALGMVATALVAFGDPRKAFVVVTTLVIVPWVILTFDASPRRRLPWWACGVIGGLMIMTYQGFLIYGGLGVAAFAGLAWWHSSDRWGYVRHVLLVVAAALATSAPYALPYVVGLVTGGGQPVSDEFVAPDLVANPLPFLQPTVLGALQLAGVAGLVAYRRSAWWATPLLCLTLGALCYRVLMMTRFVLDGHTGFYHYTTRLLAPLLAVAGMLTLARLARRRGWLAYGPAALALAVVWAGTSYWRVTLPEGVAPWSTVWPAPNVAYTTRAHEELAHPGIPIKQIQGRVEEVMGRGARPRVLSADERLFAYLPWRGYTSVDRTSANTLIRWDDRHAELARLAAVTDPARFAAASAATRFGGIDVFVLKAWHWRDIAFTPAQFDPDRFWVFDDLPGRTALLIRK
ncbi:MAG: arabinofuranosyltransferase [Nonomuraea sp.]|nr:arabinofuranosyltransferase [Nonomuraea sp.]